MNARDVKPGYKVNCPPDRGDKAYTGTVTHVSHEPQTHACLSKPFLWITVRHPDGRSSSVWPSNRLGLDAPA